MTQLAIGAVLAMTVALGARVVRALDAGGAAAAFAIGTIAFGIGGWPAALVLFAFFVPATLFSRIGTSRKHGLADVGKQGPRDAWQVLANGGVAAVSVLLAIRWPIWSVAYAGAFAAAAADTLATEIGTMARATPRSILTFRPIDAGLSGGITPLGTLAECAGAALIAIVASLAHVAPFLPVFFGGILGATIDSLLGAGVQALRYCPRCRCDCETDPHLCGAPTRLRRGFSWAGNDAVNFAATLCGAAIAMALARI